MDEPKFEPVDLEALQDAGVLMAANEEFFWPLGLALTWIVDRDHPEVKPSELHIREWNYPDGHNETIEVVGDDFDEKRRQAFRAWLLERYDSLPAYERSGALQLLWRLKRRLGEVE